MTEQDPGITCFGIYPQERNKSKEAKTNYLYEDVHSSIAYSGGNLGATQTPLRGAKIVLVCVSVCALVTPDTTAMDNSTTIKNVNPGVTG